jgi:UPF0271 protein
MKAVELNCDLGEGAPWDEDLIPLVASINVACGVHAGDEATMQRCVALAKNHGVALGAHPGLPDRTGFGRREVDLAARDVQREVYEQTVRLQQLAKAAGVALRHVKPHGVLYNQAARDPAVATAVAAGVFDAGPELWLMGLAGSRAIEASHARGLGVLREAFADRTYEADGALTPRSCPGAVIEDIPTIVAQTLDLVLRGRIRARDGTELEVEADTVCLHGDGSHAVETARALRSALAAAGVEVRAHMARSRSNVSREIGVG